MRALLGVVTVLMQVLALRICLRRAVHAHGECVGHDCRREPAGAADNERFVVLFVSHMVRVW